ncbi:transglutaminase-like cysteine peptidase [Gilvimarinus xylanilyticus]|uniref:Transglutaminase-like cysteine peptidase n=1 Tax=Gilvimarinus xylanilyticus TaxID=2944139 RepID=A0A9X2HZ28_9GAMM|nr:transglutaminase-like cysteine peptidase [Gilvimarinus xylanilyticus]MCP8899131.1 transglutaminase-like cysteine peptidase [Gilvimarinus xylanilyticus]
MLMLSGLSPLALQQSKLEAQMQSRYGEDGQAYLNAWFRLLDEQLDSEINEQLEQVNRFFNLGITFSDDRLLWKQKDYWATPLQTMGTRGGDCEDFSIAKYFSLLELGIPADKLRLIYVRAKTPGRVQAHMVLGYFPSPNAEPLLLDNLNPNILPASERPDLTPVFSFNSQGLWLGGTKSESDPTSRLSRWRDVLQRMHDEGF